MEKDIEMEEGKKRGGGKERQERRVGKGHCTEEGRKRLSRRRGMGGKREGEVENGRDGKDRREKTRGEGN